MKKENNLRKEFTRYFWKNNTLWIGLACGSMVILSAYNLVISWLLQTIIDIASGNSEISLIEVVEIAIVTFLAFMTAYAVYRVARPKFIKKAMIQYKEAVFNKLAEKNISSFSKENSSKYISAFTNDMKSIEEHYLDSILVIVDLSVSFLGAVVLMLYYSPLLTIAALVLSALPIVASLPLTNKLEIKEKDVSIHNEDFVGVIKDILGGFSVVKSFHAEKEISSLFSKENEKLESVKYFRNTTDESLNLLGTAASVVMRLGIFIIGAWMAKSGFGITPGVVLVFLQLMNYIIAPIERVPAIIANRKSALALIDKMALALKKNVRENGEKSIGTLKDKITVKDLHISFDENQSVLNNVNIEFQVGKKYAIVGSSGSGKSTLLNVLMGSFDNYEGSIFFDDIELKDIKPESIFELITLIQQNVFVFNDTISNNVTMYKEFDEQILNEVYTKASLDGIIKLKGKDYICGENGSALSGGEKQRISIARSLLTGASIMLIDEATSALDSNTAFEITNTILNMEGLTRIVVTHRLEEKLLNQYDEILVMNSGTIIEKGSFTALMAQKGMFYSLFTVSQS